MKMKSHNLTMIGNGLLELQQRVAVALNWSIDDVNSFSLLSLRDIVRPHNPRLAYEISCAIQNGDYILGRNH